MADSEVAISVKGVSKDFLLPHEKNNSIKTTVVNVFKKRSRSVETQHALKNISFDIKQGEFFGILGRNGSGKSTLLKILAEIYQPSKGEVNVKGKLVPFIELGVGFNPELTGRENVYLNGALLGFSRKEIDARYDDIVKFAELEAFMDQKLKNYSSGMQVRLAFSVATRAEADVLLVDEVLAVGDADFQRKCFDYFKTLKKSGKTVVFVTHDMMAVREYCDKAILISDGKIAFEGNTDMVADEYLKLFISKSKDGPVSDEKDRWGTGEITFAKVSHDVGDETITFNFKVKNNTKKHFDSVDIGVDFYSEDKLITGTNFRRTHPHSLEFKPGEVKNIEFKIKNTLGAHNFDVNLNIKADGGNIICEEWKRAIQFRNTLKNSKFFRISVDPIVFDEV